MKRLRPLWATLAVLLGLGVLTTLIHGPGGYGLFGQPRIVREAPGNIPFLNPPASHHKPAKPKPKAVPCIQPGSNVHSHDNVNVSPIYKEGIDSFGPPPGTTPYDLAGDKAELLFRLCGRGPPHGHGVGPDQRLFASLWTKVNGGNPNDHMSERTWIREVNQFVGHDILWSEAALEYRSFANPQTELMIPGHFPRIYLVRGTVHGDLFLRLPVRARNGQIKVLWLRRACGYQPYDASPQDFPTALPVAS